MVKEVPLLCSASGDRLPSLVRTQGGPKGKAHLSQLSLCAFPLFRERQMRSALLFLENSSATGSNKTRAAGPGRAGSVEDPGLLLWAQEPGSLQGPWSLLPRTWRPDVFLARGGQQGSRVRVPGARAHMRSPSSLFLMLPPFFLS